MTAHLGRLHAASVLDAGGTAQLVIKGTNGTVTCEVPEQFTEPFEMTASELSDVYDDDTSDGSLVGDGGVDQ